jgi:hypothetical protein
MESYWISHSLFKFEVRIVEDIFWCLTHYCLWRHVMHLRISIEFTLWHWVGHLPWHCVDPSTLTYRLRCLLSFLQSSLTFASTLIYGRLILWSCYSNSFSSDVIVEFPVRILMFRGSAKLFGGNPGVSRCLNLHIAMQCWSLILRKSLSRAIQSC